MKKTRVVKSLKNLESLYEPGENPKGFTAQTANGTAHAFGTGWNKSDPNYFDVDIQVPEGGAWQGRNRRSTRTGE